LYTIDLTEYLFEQGWDDKNSSLIPSAWKIYLVIQRLLYIAIYVIY